jgi:beta-barrel assembly-enhancing protease
MRRPAALFLALLVAGSARAQFSLNLDNLVNTAKDVGKMSKGVAGIGPEEELSIGGSVAIEIASRYGGVVRDEAMTRRVNLVGKALARYSSRPDLPWRFGVLGSQTVNAFSAPGGYVFITRGLYDTLGSDDALAAVLAHEITHIARRHALKIIARNEFFSGAMDLASQKSANLAKFDAGIDQITSTLFEKGFDPQTEYEADSQGRVLAITTGYAPGGLRFVLLQLQARGGDPHAVFSTHPPLDERIRRLPADPVPPSETPPVRP